MIEFFKSIYYWFVTFLAAIASFIFFPCRTYGRENIPRQGGCIYASNHESNIDPILLPVCSPRQMRFMAKEELFAGIMGPLMTWGGGFPVRRGSVDRGALQTFLEQIKKGYPVLIFPQGTRGGAKIQSGVGFLAAQSGAPVVPIYIHGTAEVMPPKAKFPRRRSVSLTFGKPLTFSKDEAYDEIARQVMEAVEGLKSKA